jgi:uncharacterized protein YrrD
MTIKTSDVIGKPVISADGGEKLGSVSDLLLDDRSRELIGVVVTHGMLKNEQVLPAAAVQSFGRDVVVSRTSELIATRDWRASHDTTPQVAEPESRTP